MTTYLPKLTLPDAVFNNLPVSVLLPVALGTLVGYSMRPKDTERAYLSWKQPPLRPPPWVFGPAWTILYGLMGYAAHRAVHFGTSPLNSAATIAAARHGATLYSIQLELNLAWMPLFFGLRRPVEATIDVLALLGINGYLAYLWGSSVDSTAGWLLVPYVAWLGFATYLSAGTGYLNNWDLTLDDTKKAQ
ncbi:TspO/MBR-related protein [Lasiosphaeria miniovina]|uniref:TspO/MBR-related protein n=1 Tax=Lasiosphaeria miniovina TaxID=1954250 RepID=A0AA40BGW9_9PEZI|nr:TspO/MBR-related protein [Lasiosphaeria miniovina]KAK0734020.1 TspO/MBR-related protein [Lasiosphaeria miniovina]